MKCLLRNLSQGAVFFELRGDDYSVREAGWGYSGGGGLVGVRVGVIGVLDSNHPGLTSWNSVRVV